MNWYFGAASASLIGFLFYALVKQRIPGWLPWRAIERVSNPLGYWLGVCNYSLGAIAFAVAAFKL